MASLATTCRRASYNLHAVVLAGVLVFASSGHVAAQPTASNTRLVLINAGLGGFTAGLMRAAHGESFISGFAKGAAGGAVVSAGRSIIAKDGARYAWSGRMLAAIGSSEIRNVSQGRSMLSEIIVPVGFVRLYVTTTRHIKIAPRLDVAGAFATIAYARYEDTWFDWRESLVAGAIVFTQPEASDPLGSQRAGVIRVADIPPNVYRSGQNFVRPSVTRHELVHATQYDFISDVWGEPLEGWILGKLKNGPVIHRYLDLGLIHPLITGVATLIEHDKRPWEVEANSISNGR